jgi:hypothetical protein
MKKQLIIFVCNVKIVDQIRNSAARSKAPSLVLTSVQVGVCPNLVEGFAQPTPARRHDGVPGRLSHSPPTVDDPSVVGDKKLVMSLVALQAIDRKLFTTIILEVSPA